MENTVLNISMQQLKNVPEIQGVGEDLFIFSGSGKDKILFDKPFRTEGILIAVCMDGSIVNTMNLNEYLMTKGTMLFKMPGDIVTINQIAENSKICCIIVSNDFLKNMLHLDFKGVMPVMAYLRTSPQIQLSDSELQQFERIYSLMEDLINTHHYRDQIMMSILSSFIYLICNIVKNAEKLDEQLPNNKSVVNSRKAYHMKKFIRLLGEHCKYERSVSFYADKLFVTPKHLSSIVKEVSGKSAGEWIDEYVIMEAKTLLKLSETSVQEIAYNLNFPNPSFFGRYFKKHTGVTPGDYKKKGGVFTEQASAHV